jgi:hypothetical protein
MTFRKPRRSSTAGLTLLALGVVLMFANHSASRGHRGQPLELGSGQDAPQDWEELTEK